MAQYQPTPEEQRWLDSADTEFTTYDLLMADRGGEIAPTQEPFVFVRVIPKEKVVYARPRLPRVTSLGIACMGMVVAMATAVPYLFRSPAPVATVSNVQPMENVSINSSTSGLQPWQNPLPRFGGVMTFSQVYPSVITSINWDKNPELLVKYKEAQNTCHVQDLSNSCIQESLASESVRFNTHW